MGASLLRTEEQEMPHGSHANVTMEYWKRPSDLPGYDDYADMGHFRYDRDWGWLMPVLEKIARMGRTYSVGIREHGSYCEIRLGDFDEVGCFDVTTIAAAWKAILDFIELQEEAND